MKVEKTKAPYGLGLELSRTLWDPPCWPEIYDSGNVPTTSETWWLLGTVWSRQPSLKIEDYSLPNTYPLPLLILEPSYTLKSNLYTILVNFKFPIGSNSGFFFHFFVSSSSIQVFKFYSTFFHYHFVTGYTTGMRGSLYPAHVHI